MAAGFGPHFLTSGQQLSHFCALFPRAAMALFSRISVFFSGWSRVLDTMAFATAWMGTDMEEVHTALTAPKNLRANHSPGRLSCLSTSRTLEQRNKNLFMWWQTGNTSQALKRPRWKLSVNTHWDSALKTRVDVSLRTFLSTFLDSKCAVTERVLKGKPGGFLTNQLHVSGVG